MTGSDREAIPDVRELSASLPDVPVAFPDVQEWLGGPPGCPGVVGRPSRMSGSGREALPNVRKWSRGPPGCPLVVYPNVR